MSALHAFADGAPMGGAAGSGPRVPQPHRSYAPEPRGLHRIRQFEGPRGYSTRAAVYLRYVGYLLVIIMCSSFCQAAFAGEDRWRNGGKWMLFAACLTLATGAVGTWTTANLRNEIVTQTRHFLFGLTVWPGVGIAAIMWAARGLTSGADLNGDAFLSLISNALPIVYFCTVIIPPIVFIKTISGMRTLHRSHLDDEEMMRMYTRQDSMQR